MAVIPPINKAIPSGNILLAGKVIIRDMARMISILFSKGVFIKCNLAAKLEKKARAVKEIEQMQGMHKPNGLSDK